jgi:hypothetical protein
VDAPCKIDGAVVLETAEIQGRAVPTGATRHFSGEGEIGPVPHLALAQYSGESGVYLFYCDENWTVLSDTFHDSVAAAKSQAEFEYARSITTWRKANAV